MSELENHQWIIVPKRYRVTRIEPNRYDLVSTLPLAIELRKLNYLGPGLRVESKGRLTGAHRVFRISTDPLGDPRVFEPELVFIPGGKSRLRQHARGMVDKTDHRVYPSHQAYLNEYWIGRYPVTVSEFAFFVEHYGHYTSNEERFGYDSVCWRQPSRGDYRDIQKYGRHPVTMVSISDAEAYCRWLSNVTGKKYSLPTQGQWEMAAYGADQREYPWGDEEPNPTLCNIEHWFGGTTPVGKFSPKGDGRNFGCGFGCADMFGNVSEWTLNSHSHSVKVHPDCDPDFFYYKRITYRVVYGQSWRMGKQTRTDREKYNSVSDHLGFRVVARPFHHQKSGSR